MFKIHTRDIVAILFCFLWLHMVLVTCTHETYYRFRKKGSAVEKVKLAGSTLEKHGRNKTSTPSIRVKLPKAGQYKNVSKVKSPNRNGKKETNTSKIVFHAKSPVNKTLNVTKNNGVVTKGSLRLGNRNKYDQWPKIQKPRLRVKESDSPRVTKMNMMQLDDATPFPTMSSIQKLSVQESGINEILSPYTIRQQMERIKSYFNNVNTTVEVIGRTLEYNEIVLLKMTQVYVSRAYFRADDKKYVDETNEKKIIFIVHGLSVMGMISLDCLVEEKKFLRLVSYYLEHLDKFDIFLIPMANPDGYGYKMEMWNKNLSPQEACPGVAIDRNFDIGWNDTRVISSCSQQYPGPAPFSEPESRAVRDVLHRYSHKIVAYIHVHGGTYSTQVFKGDAVLYPKGYTDVQSDDDKYIDLKGEIDETMRKASFQVYSVTVDTLYNWYGRVTGASVDYASTVYGVPYAMEFVMQLYADEDWVKAASEESTAYHVVVEVWKRVIDVVATNIWNSLHSNEA